jgi:hypothetical protein
MFFTAVQNVRLWHKADMRAAFRNVRFWGGIADIAVSEGLVCFFSGLLMMGPTHVTDRVLSVSRMRYWR